MRYVPELWRRLTRKNSRESATVQSPAPETLSDESLEVEVPELSAAEECVEVFREQLRELLMLVREVVSELQQTHPTEITLRRINRRLNQRARHLDSHGRALEALTRHLRCMYDSSAGDLFDKAVQEGESPLRLIGVLLGC